jgi:hypothetical protein
MAIDAVIADVYEVEDGYRLELADYEIQVEDRRYLSIAGQPFMTILNPTWKPEPGMRIWGGSGSCQILWPGEDSSSQRRGHWYDRIGYARLRESTR